MSTRYPGEPLNQNGQPTGMDLIRSASFAPAVMEVLKNPVASLQFSYNSIPSDRVKWLDESVPVAAVEWSDDEPSTADVARGVLGYAQVTANQGPVTTEADLTGLTVTVDVPAGRYIQVTGSGHVTNSATGNSTGVIYEDANAVGRWHRNSVASIVVKSEGSVVRTPTAGSHTYKLTLLSTGAGATLGAGASLPAFIKVTDEGPA